MQIIVNHLTRMKGSRICIAGIAPATFAHVRPVTPPSDLITRNLLRENGGPFAVGTLVDLGEATPQPTAPETEDHRFHTRNVRLVEEVSPDVYWEMLGEIACDTLLKAFGAELEPKGRGYAVEEGQGVRSLAVLRVRGRPQLALDGYGKLRLSLRYPDDKASLGVNDVRFYEPDHQAIREDVVAAVNRRLRRGIQAFAMLGLARAWRASGDDRDRHYLQVNGLCLADNPTGDTP